jgi:FtsH-binding integral membrane protein
MQSISTTRSESQILATNKVLKNTYALLSVTLFFSVIMALVSMAVQPPQGVGLFTMLAEEEKKIRTDPVARSTELLKKVFGR